MTKTRNVQRTAIAITAIGIGLASMDASAQSRSYSNPGVRTTLTAPAATAARTYSAPPVHSTVTFNQPQQYQRPPINQPQWHPQEQRPELNQFQRTENYNRGPELRVGDIIDSLGRPMVQANMEGRFSEGYRNIGGDVVRERLIFNSNTGLYSYLQVGIGLPLGCSFASDLVFGIGTGGAIVYSEPVAVADMAPIVVTPPAPVVVQQPAVTQIVQTPPASVQSTVAAPQQSASAPVTVIVVPQPKQQCTTPTVSNAAPATVSSPPTTAAATAATPSTLWTEVKGGILGVVFVGVLVYGKKGYKWVRKLVHMVNTHPTPP
jgi:hypothetical protein